MTDREKRRSKRFDSMNLLHYKVLDASNGQLGDGMARTLNVSEGGLLLQTNTPFKAGQGIAVNIGLEEDEVDVLGKIVHCKPSGDGLFVAGVQFDNLAPDAARILSTYLTLFKAANDSA